MLLMIATKPFAEVVELADAQASGACGSNTVWVQVPSSALKKSDLFGLFFVLFKK